MEFKIWFLIIGLLLIAMAISKSFINRLPLTATIFYLIIGLILGPLGIEFLFLDPLNEAELFERISEAAVIVSLFNAGLKLRRPLRDKTWFLPLKLAFLSMVITVSLITFVAYYFLSLPLGAAIILGAVIAPTDPVLASEVQLKDASDKNRLRFSLTGEAGLNDGSVFPFVMLGLGLLGLHEIGKFGWKWFAVDVVWAILGGLALGAFLSYLVGNIILYIRKKHKEALELDEFIAIGLIGLSYGLALLINTYGFLSVFAAGAMFRSIERRDKEAEDIEDKISEQEKAINPKTASKYMADTVLVFNEQLENILEVAVVILVGAAISYAYLPVNAIWFVPLLFFFIRPVSVYLGLAGNKLPIIERNYIAWFGIRGIGSIYYLMYSIGNGLPDDIAAQLITYTLIIVVASIIIHGITVTPLMNRYKKKIE